MPKESHKAESEKEKLNAMIAAQREMGDVSAKQRIQKLGKAAYESITCGVCHRALYRCNGPICPECFEAVK